MTKKIAVQCPNCKHIWDRKPTAIEKAYGVGTNADKKTVLFYLYPWCWICGGRFDSKEDATIEHIRPIVLGGGDELANLTLTHQKCNLAKAGYWPGDHTTFINKIRNLAKVKRLL